MNLKHRPQRLCIKIAAVVCAVCTILQPVTAVAGYLSDPGVGSGAGHADISTDGTWIHTFTADGTFTVNSEIKNATILVVGGGGGGGAYYGGGGGAGGLVYTDLTLSDLSYDITVGAGGAGELRSSYNAKNGDDSKFGSLVTALGGGGGGGSLNDGSPGGSGGGAKGGQGGNATQPTSTWGGFGYKGSSAFTGGGGGAGGTSTDTSGGPGTAYSISGESVIYAIGGNGGDDGATAVGYGGGGGSSQITKSPGKNGNAGVVIVSYPKTAPPAGTLFLFK